MDMQMTQILEEEKNDDDNDDDNQVGILCVGTTEHAIGKGFTKIGRSPALCKIVLDDLTVSKVHAEIQAGCETAFISDVRSANGTKIRDVSLKPFFYYTINDGDPIYLGSVKAIFKTNKSTQFCPLTLPETPIPSRRFDEDKTPGAGNASDFLFNNTSINQSNDSAIPGTQQKSKKSQTFQKPTAPADRRRIGSRISAASTPASERISKIVTKSQDDDEPADFHELETQKMEHDSILGQSRAQRKPRSEENEPHDDDDIYDAETQVFSLPMENERAKNEEKITRSRTRDSVASSSRGDNCTSNFSHLPQLSPTSSPPPSPNPLNANGDFILSQNLLEMCEAPLLELEKKANGSGKSEESIRLNNSVKSDAATSKENSGVRSTENIANREKSSFSNHVIAESEDESATDDDQDTEIEKSKPEIRKFGISAKPSDVIEDDSATDDEGHFESLAARSPPKKESKLSSKIRTKTRHVRKTEENVSDEETQQIDRKQFKLSGAKFRKETTDVRENEDGIFDAETQQIEREIPAEIAKKRQENEANVFDAETQKMDVAILKIPRAKKLRESAEGTNIFEAATQRVCPESSRENSKKDREPKENIFDAETQRMDVEIGEVAKPKKRRQIAANCDVDANIFEVQTQKMGPESPGEVRAKKPRASPENRAIETNIFDAATQRMDDDISDLRNTKKLREIGKIINDDNDIDLLATQRMDDDISDLGNTKKRRDIVKNLNKDNDLDLLATQRMDDDISDLGNTKKRRDIAKNLNKDNDLDLLATQRMDDDISDLGNTKKLRDIAKNINIDNDLDLLRTQLLNVPTSTPFSEWRKKIAWKNVLENSSSEESGDESPKSVDKNTGNAKEKQAEVNSASPSRSPKSKGHQTKKSPRLKAKNDGETSPKQIIESPEVSAGKKSKKRSTGGNSSFGDESTEKEKNDPPANLDETLIRNLGIILDQEANNQELDEESTQLMTQNLVDILRPTQSFEESKSRDSEDEIAEDTLGIVTPKKKRKEISRPPSTLGFVDGQAVTCGKWSDEDTPKASSTMREDKKKDDEKKGKKTSPESKLSEWLDPNGPFFGLPEVKIRGTLSTPGSPGSSTKSSKDEATKSHKSNSRIVGKKSNNARNKIAKKIVEDQNSDETFAYNDLKKMAENLLASGSAGLAKSEKKGNDVDAEEPETVSTTGRQSSRRPRQLANPSSPLIVSDYKGKSTAEDTTRSTVDESSTSRGKKTAKALPKSKKAANSRAKAAKNPGKESQEVEAILATPPKENVPLARKRSYAKVQLTRLDDSDISQHSSSASEKLESPRNTKKRRATISAKDVAPKVSLAYEKNWRSISEGIAHRAPPKEQHKILLTGLKEEHTKLAKKLGGLVVSEPSKATVLITDKVRRTYKFLCAVARGLRVVSVNWLLESQKASRFLDCDDFILRDPAAEEFYKFKLEESLKMARTRKFLQGYTIVVTPKVNQPEIHELKDMIEASGGKILTRAPGVRAWNTKTVIVSREEDLTALKALLSKCPKSLKITVHSVEFILSGILRQEVDLVEHKLNIP